MHFWLQSPNLVEKRKFVEKIKGELVRIPSLLDDGGRGQVARDNDIIEPLRRSELESTRALDGPGPTSRTGPGIADGYR